tara:strand:+ start:470 stop:970 length:501 start_codon:yes stop_codon:yes gene_type:complete
MFCHTFKTQVGWITAGISQLGIVKISLPEKSPEISVAKFKNQMNFHKSNSRIFQKVIEKIQSYFEGYPTDFTDISVDLSQLSNFQKITLNECRKIKTGQTRSYKWLAKKINHPKSYRAIGNALSKNPVPIIIPCHRVISIDGTIGGYMGKEKKIYFKKQLLELERK